MARMRGTRWTYRKTMWDPRIGRRQVGSQRTRWADSLTQLAGTNERGDQEVRKCIKSDESFLNVPILAHIC